MQASHMTETRHCQGLMKHYAVLLAHVCLDGELNNNTLCCSPQD